jgi:osmotically-inducible protein OsmY
MKTSRFWSHVAQLGLGSGVAVALAGAPVVAHAEDNTPSGAMQRGSEATGNAATNAGNAAGNATDNAGNAADQAGSATSGAAQKAGDEATGAGNKASDTAQGAADQAQGAADQAQGAADQAQGAADRANSAAAHAGTATDDSSITNAVKTKLKSGDMGYIKVDTDNGVVTLSGTVHQQSTRDHAVKMAKTAKGVKKVKNDIDVVPAK